MQELKVLKREFKESIVYKMKMYSTIRTPGRLREFTEYCLAKVSEFQVSTDPTPDEVREFEKYCAEKRSEFALIVNAAQVKADNRRNFYRRRSATHLQRACHLLTRTAETSDAMTTITAKAATAQQNFAGSANTSFDGATSTAAMAHPPATLAAATATTASATATSTAAAATAPATADDHVNVVIAAQL